MLVVDAMHCLLEGLVHFHGHHVLHLNMAACLLNPENLKYAIDHPFLQYDSDMVPPAPAVDDDHTNSILKIQDTLCLALEGEKSIMVNRLWSRLRNGGTLGLLRFVAWSLGLYPSPILVRPKILALYTQLKKQKPSQPIPQLPHPPSVPWYKDHFIALLIDWVSMLYIVFA